MNKFLLTTILSLLFFVSKGAEQSRWNDTIHWGIDRLPSQLVANDELVVKDLRTLKEPIENCYARTFTLNGHLMCVTIRSWGSGIIRDVFTVFRQDNDTCQLIANGEIVIDGLGVLHAMYYENIGTWLNWKKIKEPEDINSSLYVDFDERGEIRWFLSKSGDTLLAEDFRISYLSESNQLVFYAGEVKIGTLPLPD